MLIEKVKQEFTIDRISAVLGKKMNPAEFVEAATVLAADPAIMACKPESVMGAILKAALFGFRLNKELGQCWVIPRKIKTGTDANNKAIYEMVAVFQIGYKGWMKLANEGSVESWDYATVFENEQFEMVKGTNANLYHKPIAGTNAQKGRRIGYYAGAYLKGSGRFVFHYINMEEAEEYRRYSEQQYDYSQGQGKVFSQSAKGIWASNYDAMALRLPIREIATKKAPLTERIEQAVNADEGVTYYQDGKVVEVTPKEVAEKTEVLELHEDYLSEITACKTKEALKVLYDQRLPEVPDNLKEQYRAEIIKHSETI